MNKDTALPPLSKIKLFSNKLLNWYYQFGRDFPWRGESTPIYHKIIAEILLQRTKATTVNKHFIKFISRFNSWNEIADATDDDLKNNLIPFGLWRLKTGTLKKLANEMINTEGRLPSSYLEIRKLPGVGQYIANAIALFYLKEPRPLLDINMARVLERYFGPRKLVDIRDDPYLQLLSKTIIEKTQYPIETNYAILDFAAIICKSKPFCENCPFVAKCKHT